MMKNNAFDPCRSARELMELLYENGMLEEAMSLSRRIDSAQALAWREQLPDPRRAQGE